MLVFIFQIVIKSSTIQAEKIVEGLKRLLPVNKTNYPFIKQVTSDEEKILPDTCFVEETESSCFSCKWKDKLPVKCKLFWYILIISLHISNSAVPKLDKTCTQNVNQIINKQNIYVLFVKYINYYEKFTFIYEIMNDEIDGPY